MNSILKLELKSRLGIKKLIPAMLLRIGFLGVAFSLILLSRIGKDLLALFLSEALLFLLFTPNAISIAFSSASARISTRDLKLTKISPFSIFLGKFAGAGFYNCIIIFLSFLIMLIASLYRKNLHLQPLIFVHIAIISIALLSGALSLLFSAIFHKNIFTSSVFTYILIIILIGSVIIPGPVMTRIKNQEIKSSIAKAALYISPFVMTSRSLGNIDIMRTQYMYQIADPIVSPGFAYPDWYYSGILYFCMSFLILLPAYLLFRFNYNRINNL